MKKFLLILTVVFLVTSIGIAYSAEPKKVTPAGVKAAPKEIDAFGSIKVLYPNGGEIWGKGKKYTIRWEGKGLSGNVKIMLKWGTGSGGWFMVTESAVNSGSYNYTVPKSGIGQEGNQFKIYVMTRDESIKDASDKPFTISSVYDREDSVEKLPPRIQVLYPNGGETWIVGDIYTIRWETRGEIDKVKILLEDKTENKKYWVTYGQNANIGNPGFFKYEVKIHSNGNAFRIKIMTLDGAITDESDKNFIIKYSDPICHTYIKIEDCKPDDCFRCCNQRFSGSDIISENKRSFCLSQCIMYSNNCQHMKVIEQIR